MVLPQDDTDMCMTEGVKAVDILLQLTRVVDDSVVGRFLAAKALRDGQQERFKTVVGDTLADLPDAKWTADVFETN